jgi:branched-chain amino acid transport system permease protein
MATPPKAPLHKAGTDMGAILKDCLLAGLLAAAIFAPIVGLKTTSAPGGLMLEQRWLYVVIGAAIVFAGRLALHLLFWSRRDEAAKRKAKPSRLAEKLEPLTPFIGATLLGGAILLPFLPSTDRYVLDLGILILTYVMLGWGLNIVVGLAGLLDLGYVAFYAVGAYSYALLSTRYFPMLFPESFMPWAFWFTLPVAGMLAALWGIILGFPVLRLRGDYLAIVTLAFGEIIRVVLQNWYTFTGGPNGISGIPRPSFFGIEFTSGPGGFADTFGLEFTSLHRITFLYYIILVLALVTNFVTLRLRRLPIGRAWEALREDEIACRSLGINTTNTKLTAFAMGAMFGGFAGSFFATRQGFVSPESFVFMESALVLAIVVLGGLGSQIGVAIAAVVMIGGFELFRNLDFLKAVFGANFDPAQFRMIIFGLAMVLIMIWRPRGLVTRRDPTIFLKEKKAVAGDLVAEGHG